MNNTTKLLTLGLLTTGFAASSMMADPVVLNKALYDFEFQDAANSTIAVNDLDLNGNSEFWSTNAGAGEIQYATDRGDASNESGENFGIFFLDNSSVDAGNAMTSIAFGPTINAGDVFTFDFSISRRASNGAGNVRFDVFSATNDTLLSSAEIIADDAAYELASNNISSGALSFSAGAGDAFLGEQIYLEITLIGAGNRSLVLDEITLDVSAVPEPSAYAMLAGLLSLSLAAVRRKK